MAENKPNIAEGGFLKGKKTYITAILAVLGAVGAYLTGDLALTETIQVVIPAIMAATVRNGIG